MRMEKIMPHLLVESIQGCEALCRSLASFELRLVSNKGGAMILT